MELICPISLALPRLSVEPTAPVYGANTLAAHYRFIMVSAGKLRLQNSMILSLARLTALITPTLRSIATGNGRVKPPIASSAEVCFLACYVSVRSSNVHFLVKCCSV